MAMQTSVGLYVAPGVVGDKATPDQSHYYPLNVLAATGGVKFGSFCWLSSGALANAGSGKPLGLCERVINHYISDVLDGSIDAVPAGDPVHCAVEGDYFVKTLTTATVGQKVFASTTDGSVKTGATGASVSGYVETDWTVATAGSANDIIIIYKH